jgi:hypothetical protein
VGLAVATTGVDNTIRADARFYWYLDFRVFQQYLRIAAIHRTVFERLQAQAPD